MDSTVETHSTSISSSTTKSPYCFMQLLRNSRGIPASLSKMPVHSSRNTTCLLCMTSIRASKNNSPISRTLLNTYFNFSKKYQVAASNNRNKAVFSTLRLKCRRYSMTGQPKPKCNRGSLSLKNMKKLRGGWSVLPN